MHNEPVSVSFRALVENRLKQVMNHGSAVSQPGQNDSMASSEPEIRTEVNLRVLSDYLKT